MCLQVQERPTELSNTAERAGAAHNEYSSYHPFKTEHLYDSDGGPFLIQQDTPMLSVARIQLILLRRSDQT
jgi:hypothetical protein